VEDELNVPVNITTRAQRGVALLAVLWLSVALSFIALSTSYLVRTEVEAASNRIESERSYYLARGGVEAAVYSLIRSAGQPPEEAEFRPGQRWLEYEFPEGVCRVEVVPENAKISINTAPPELLAALFASLGMPQDKSIDLAAAIVHWRSARSSSVDDPLDLYYAALPRPYPARHASLEHLEELLPVRGMTRDLFFGRMQQNSQGEWRRWPALPDLLTTEVTGNAINPNYAAHEVLRALPGWNDTMAANVVRVRNVTPFTSLAEMESATPDLLAASRLSPLTFAQGPVYTLTATGALHGSGVRRTVRAVVRVGASLPLFHQVLGWWDEWAAPPELSTAAGATGRGV